MRDRRDPWKWPFVCGTTLLVLVLGVLMPRAWLSFLRGQGRRPIVPVAEQTAWLELQPPPLVEVAVPETRTPEVDVTPERVVADDPRWWSAAWRVRVITQAAKAQQPVPADSARVLLAGLGLGQDLLSTVRPDSLLAARLLLLRREDQLRFDELKPYLAAMGRAEHYADLMSRVAAMYDDFLRREIRVPD